MAAVIALIIVLLIAVVIFIEVFSPQANAPKPKEEYLTKLNKYVDGRMEKIEGMTNAYRINFEMDGGQFTFEDVEEKSINSTIDKVFLKINTESKINLFFTERKQRTQIRTGMVIASDIPERGGEEEVELKVPKSLDMFEVHTNAPALINLLFQNPQVASFLSELKNADQRGSPFIPFKITNGWVVLSFYKESMFHPNIMELSKEVATIEKYVDPLLIIDNLIRTN